MSIGSQRQGEIVKVFSRTGRISTVVGALAVVALGLSSCSSAIGVAASVGTEKITVNQLQASVNSINAARKAQALPADPKAADLPRNQLRFYVLSLLLKSAAKTYGVTISATEMASRRKGILDQLGGETKLAPALANAGIAKEDFDLYLRDVTYEERIGLAAAPAAAAGSAGDQERAAAVQASILAAGKKGNVSINPRYGTWDPATANIVAVDTTGGAVKKK